MKKLIIASILSAIILCFTACTESIAPYDAPDKDDVETALNGGEWPDEIPVPQFIDTLDNRYYDPFSDIVILEFYRADEDDVPSYAKELKKYGFKVTGVVEYFEGHEELAKKQAKAKDYNAYTAESRDYYIYIDIGTFNSDVIQFQITGLSNSEMKKMNIKEDAASGLFELDMSTEYLTKDITDIIKYDSQKEIYISEYWTGDLPVPCFIDNVTDFFEDIDGHVTVIENCTVDELLSYLNTLKEAGCKIEAGASYTYYNNAPDNSSLYSENRDYLDDAKESMEDGEYTVLLATNEKYTISFDVRFEIDDGIEIEFLDYMFIKVIEN